MRLTSLKWMFCCSSLLTELLCFCLSLNNEWFREPKHTARGTGSGHARLLHGIPHADHMPPLAAALLKQKQSNRHVTFDLFTYCHVLLTEVTHTLKQVVRQA